MAESIKELQEIISAPKIIPRKKRKKGLNFNPLDSSSSNEDSVAVERAKRKNKKEKKLKIKSIKTVIQEEKVHKAKRINRRESGNKVVEDISPELIKKEVEEVAALEKSEERLKEIEEKVDEEDEMFGKWMKFVGDETEEGVEEEIENSGNDSLPILEEPIDFESEEEALDEIEQNFEELKKTLPDEFKTEVENPQDDGESAFMLARKGIEQTPEDKEEGDTSEQNIVEDDGELTDEWVKFLKENDENMNEQDTTETPEDTNSSKIRKNDVEDSDQTNVEMQNGESLQKDQDHDQTNEDGNMVSDIKSELIQDEGDLESDAKDIKTQNISSLLNKKISEQSEIILELKKEIELLKEKQKPEKVLTEKEKRQKQFEDKLQQGQKLGFFGGGSNVEIHDYSNPSKIKIEKIFDDSKQKVQSKPISLLKLLLIFLGLVFVIILMLIVFFCFAQEVQPDCGCIEIKQLVEKIF